MDTKNLRQDSKRKRIRISRLFRRRRIAELPPSKIIIDIGPDQKPGWFAKVFAVSKFSLFTKTASYIQTFTRRINRVVSGISATSGEQPAAASKGKWGKTEDDTPGIKRGKFKQSRLHIPLGLKNRVTLVFSAGALVLSLALATLTYITTSHSIMNQETSSLLSVAYDNAFTAKRDLQGPHPYINFHYSSKKLNHHIATVIPNLLDEITGDPLTGADSLVYVSSNWYHYPTTFTSRDLPNGLLVMVKNGVPAEQYFTYQGEPHLAIGIPIPLSGALYVGVFDLSDTATTLHILFVTLLLAGIATTIAGAVLGRWAAGRALRPLTAVSRAAQDIASGKPKTRLAITDVSDLTVLAASFNTMVDKLQERIERDARFTSDVSHELRSPLTTLATSLSVLETRRNEMSERSQKALDLLSGEVRRFQRMVSDLLEISKMDAGAAELVPDEVAIDELITKAVEQFSQSKVQVIIGEKARNLRILAEKRRIERVIANLLENADRYAGGATGVLVDTKDGFVRVSVEDNGPGIAPQDKERIFERFSRGSQIAGNRGATSGTGLGLALVQEHIKLHKGHIFVTEAKSGGACFVFEIPIDTHSQNNHKRGRTGEKKNHDL